MSFKEFIDFKIIQTDKISLTVYQILVFFVILIITWFLVKIAKRIFNRRVIKYPHAASSTYAIFQIVKYIIWIMAIGIALETIGIKFNILIASSAALLVGVGLGLQQVFMDYIAGIIILVEGVIRVNDVVEIENLVGEVKHIGLRTSRLETRDDLVVVVPNSKLVNDLVVNWSHNRRLTRFHVEVGVAYGSDIRLVKKVLLDCAEKVENISKKPVPFVRFNNFGNSSLDFQLYFFTEDSFRVENTKSNLRFMIDDKFRENGIKIPFPQRDIHVIKPDEPGL
ncbi:MAG: mechanosensitive ion channel [Bacteroidales bacterium]|nr:mechanosensitive ion channel [Bacteroidales bacterium]